MAAANSLRKPDNWLFGATGSKKKGHPRAALYEVQKKTPANPTGVEGGPVSLEVSPVRLPAPGLKP